MNFFRAARELALSWVRGAFEDAVRPLLRRAFSMALRYLVAATLAAASAVLLLGALSSGLVELGLPVWAARLILATAAAFTAFFFHKSGRNTPQEEVDAPRLRIRVVRRRPRGRRVRVFDVHPRADAEGWEVSSDRGTTSYDTKEKALEAARRRAAKAEPSRIVVHRSNGAIQDVVRYS
jgi:hypothetical protein